MNLLLLKQKFLEIAQLSNIFSVTTKISCNQNLKTASSNGSSITRLNFFLLFPYSSGTMQQTTRSERIMWKTSFSSWICIISKSRQRIFTCFAIEKDSTECSWWIGDNLKSYILFLAQGTFPHHSYGVQMCTLLICIWNKKNIYHFSQIQIS